MTHRYLIIGAGGAGRRAYTILKSLIEEDACLGILNTSQQTAIQGGIFDEGSVLEDINEAVRFKPRGVFIAVPTNKHIAYAEMFLGVSEFMIIDKPLDSDLLSCERFVRNCHNSSTRVFVNFQRRYLKCWNMLKQALSLEKDGKFEYGSIAIQSYFPDWRREKPSDALYIQSLGIVVQGWYPLGGRGYTAELLGDETINAIAKAHNVTVAQVILRWNLQRSVVVIPGSSNPDHIKENLDLFSFNLSNEEMEQIKALNRDEKHDWY